MAESGTSGVDQLGRSATMNHEAEGSRDDIPGGALRMQRPRLVNRVFYRFALTLLRPLILGGFRLAPVHIEAVPRAGAGIILSNHTALFDPIWLYAMLRRPVYFAATEDLFRQPVLARLIRWFGAFPKRKNSSADVGAMRTIFSLISNGCLVGIYPEGVRTWDGTNSPIVPGIARLIRKLRVPVYTCRTSGAYLAIPRWARYWRRVPITGEFSRLYRADAIPRDEGRIIADIEAAIRTPDYDLEVDLARVRKRGLAVNVSRLLYRCPSCGTMEGLKLVRPVRSNRVECFSCFSSYSVDVRCRLAALDESGRVEGARATLAEVYGRIRALPLTPIRTNVRLGLEAGEQLYLISRPRFLLRQESFPNLRVFAFGRLYLTNRRLIFRTRLGIPLAAPLRAIGSLSVDPGDKLHFTFQGMVHRVPFRNESALKWFDLIQRLQQSTG